MLKKFAKKKKKKKKEVLLHAQYLYCNCKNVEISKQKVYIKSNPTKLQDSYETNSSEGINSQVTSYLM